MNKCLLNKEQQFVLLKYVSSELKKKLVVDKKDYNEKEFISEIYNFVINSGASEDTAIDAVRLIPFFTNKYSAYIFGKASEYQNVIPNYVKNVEALSNIKLHLDFINEESGVENVIKYLGLDKKVDGDLLNEIEVQESRSNRIKEIINLKDDTDQGIINFLTTSIFNTNEFEGSYEIKDGIEIFNETPSKKRKMSIMRNIIDALNESKKETSEDLEVFGKKIKFRIHNQNILTELIPNSTDNHIIRLKNLENISPTDNTYAISKKDTLLYVTITDENGNLLYFDKEGNLSEDNKNSAIVLYRLTDFPSSIIKSAENKLSSEEVDLISLSESEYMNYITNNIDASEKAIYLNALYQINNLMSSNIKNITETDEYQNKYFSAIESNNQDLINQINAEIKAKALEETKKFIVAYNKLKVVLNPRKDKNLPQTAFRDQLDVVVTNKSTKGKNYTNRYTTNKISTVNIVEFKPSLGSYRNLGIFSFVLNGQEFNIKEPSFLQNQDILNTVVDLLTEKLEYQNGNPLSLEERFSFVSQYIYEGKENEIKPTASWISFDLEKGGISIDNEFFKIDTENWNNQDLKDKLILKLNSSVISEISKLDFEGYQKRGATVLTDYESIINGTAKYDSYYALYKSDNKYYLIDPIRINAVRSLVDKKSYSKVEIKDGKVTVTDENYLQFLKDNFYTNIILNTKGEVVVHNPSFVFSLTPSSSQSFSNAYDARMNALDKIVPKKSTAKPPVNTETITINSDYKGKLIFISPGSGKTSLVTEMQSDEVLDADTLLEEYFATNSETKAAWANKDPELVNSKSALYAFAVRVDVPQLIDEYYQNFYKDVVKPRIEKNPNTIILTGSNRLIPFVDLFFNQTNPEFQKNRESYYPNSSEKGISIAKSSGKNVVDISISAKDLLKNPFTSATIATESQAEKIDKSVKKVINTINDKKDPLFNYKWKLEKNVLQKSQNQPTTEAQRTAAKEWYSNSPLAPYFPFEIMERVINAGNTGPIAEFSVNGIILYHYYQKDGKLDPNRSADYTDLYHEAWHAFTQSFLTEKERNEMYAEARKKDGSFVDYQGKYVRFSDAKDWQLEEFLAEDFRKYMLSGGKVADKKAVVKNTIFRRILNFLKKLFGKSTVTDIVQNPMSNSMVSELYRKLANHDFDGTKIVKPNVSQNQVFQSPYIPPKSKEGETQEQWSYKESVDMVNTIDSLISSIMDDLNQDPNDNKFTSQVISQTLGARSSIYESILYRLENWILPNLQNQLDAADNQSDALDILNKINLVTKTIKNFGDPKNIKPGDNSFISYHIEKTKVSDFLEETSEDIDGVNQLIAAANKFDKSGNEVSIKDLASPEVKLLLKSIRRYDDQGNFLPNNLGVPQLNNSSAVFFKLAKLLRNTLNADTMYSKLQEAAKADPVIREVLSKLGKPTSTISSSDNLWTSFWQTFNLANVKLYQITMSESTDQNTGTTYKSVTIGSKGNIDKQILNKWVNNFNLFTSDYIKRDSNDNRNYIDFRSKRPTFIKIEAGGNQKIDPAKVREFLTAIGIPLSNKGKIIEFLAQTSSKDILDKLYNAIITSKTPVKDLNANIINGGVFENPNDKLAIQNMFSTLLELETQYSDYAGSFSQTNAENNTQFEQTLNNYLTILANEINDVTTYQELISKPHMAHLDVSKNPFAATSSWLNELFNIDGKNPQLPQYQRDKSKPLSLVNLSGLKTVYDSGDEYGVALASADEYSKFISDLHLVINGAQELLRHADKGTSFSMFVKGMKLFNSAEDAEFDKTATEVYDRYFVAEFNRIKKLKALEEKSKNSPIYYDAFYLKQGQTFQVFDKMFDRPNMSDVVSRLLNKYNSVDEISDNDKTLIKNSIKEYFTSLQNENYERLKEANYISNQIKNKASAYGKNLTDQDIIRLFTVNNWLQNIESTVVIYGDIALYNHEKEEFHKRNAGAGSTGALFRTDKKFIDKINNTFFDPSLNGSIGEDGSFNTAVFEDDDIKSVYIDEYIDSYEEELKEQNADKIKALADKPKEQKKLLEELRSKAEKTYKPYSEMKEGDGQGWITFEHYRAFSRLEGKWTTEQDDLFKKIMNKEYVDPTTIMKFFPPKKYQYWGPLKTTDDQLPLMGFHKFSLIPLNPYVAKEGTNLYELQKKMLKENIAYSLFKSGSKISTITKIENGKSIPDKLYKGNPQDHIFNDTAEEYVKNVGFLHYLKNQLEIAPEYKETVTFSTQMRKLVFNGLMEVGIPVDFEPSLNLSERIDLWDSIKTEEERKSRSPFYTMITDYESNIKAYTDLLKNNLREEGSFEYVDPKNPSLGVKLNDGLKKFLVKELSRKELGDHQIDYIKSYSTNGGITDLSTAITAETIEKLLYSIVANRIVRQKFLGEALVQVSGAGFENTKDQAVLSGKLTDEQRRLYGTNGLSFYNRDFTVDEKTGRKIYGKTKAMKVKISMQGPFFELLNLKHKDGNRIDSITRLNDMLKDEDWLNTDNNRKMITIIGPRIPVQGLNSMEFAEVYEFLDPSAGNIIILPSEIVAKSGGDFDIDKITFVFPSIESYPDKGFWFRDKNETGFSTEGQIIIDNLNNIFTNENINVDLSPKNVSRIITSSRSKLSQQDKEIFDLLINKSPKSVRYDTSKTTESGLQNRIMNNMRDMLEHPHNFNLLVKPNEKDVLEPISRELASDVQKQDYKTKTYEKNGKQAKKIHATSVLEYGYNMSKHQHNRIGKDVLGIGAVDNTFNSIFNRIGMRLNDSIEQTYLMYDGSKNNRARLVTEIIDSPLTIYLPHNTLKGGISLSHINDNVNENNIGDIISQAINGWVDVAKDSWIFNIQGNKELAPTLLFMIQAGVPVRQAIMMVSHPLVRKYVEYQHKYGSILHNEIGFKSQTHKFSQTEAKKFMIDKLFNNIITEENNDRVKGNSGEFENYRLDGLIAKLRSELFTDDNLRQSIFSQDQVDGKTKFENLIQGKIKSYKKNNFKVTSENLTVEDKMIFMHFLQIEDMAKAVKDIKTSAVFDTKPSTSAYSVNEISSRFSEALSNPMIPEEIAKKIKTESIIGIFDISDFTNEFFTPLFKFRNRESLNVSNILNERILISYEDKNRLLAQYNFDYNKLNAEFVNDFGIFLFQNNVSTVNLPDLFINGYKGTDVVAADIAAGGILVKEVDGVPKIFIDQKILDNEFENFKNKPVTEITKEFNVDGKSIRIKVPQITNLSKMFKTIDQYYKYMIEKELLRYRYRTEGDGYERLKSRSDYQKVINSIPNQEEYNQYKDLIAIEIMLQNMALDNSFNLWKMFESNDSVANQYIEILKLYRNQLEKNYTVIDYLTVSESKDGSIKNLSLTDPRLEKDDINKLYDEIVELSNPASIKLDNISEQERTRIAEFFAQLPIYAFMQSGQNTNSRFSIIGILPHERVNIILKDLVSKFSKTQALHSIVYGLYAPKFIGERIGYGNTINFDQFSKSRRYRNYIVGDSQVISSISYDYLDTTTNTDGNVLYNTPRTEFSILNYLNSNPDVVIVGDGTINPVSQSDITPVQTTQLSTQPTAQPATPSQSPINIYSTDKNGFQGLSNLLNGPVKATIEGVEKTFKTVEHLYQIKKALFAGDKNTANLIFKAKDGFEAQKLGSSKGPIKWTKTTPEDWDKISTQELESSMRLAFEQNQAAKDLLLKTGDAQLTHKTKFSLGKWETVFPEILMKIREEFKGTQPSTQPTTDISGFLGYKGGFEDVGKGTPEGDGKDKAMRQVAGGFILELDPKRENDSSTGTTAKEYPNYREGVMVSSKNFYNDIVMLARNNEFKNKPLSEETKASIKDAHDEGVSFVVGDMPGVDSQFIDYLQEIGAKFTIYHTGTTSRIQVKQPTTQPSTQPAVQPIAQQVEVVSPDYGVVRVDTNPTKQDTQNIINLIAPQIEKQAYKENVGVNANWQFSFGNMWSRVNLTAKPLLVNSFAGVNKVTQLIEELKKQGKTIDKTKFIYDYHELDQDGNPLPSLKELQPLIDKIQNALGIDMSDYDSMLGNIYLDNQSIAPHRDTTESKSAEGYPVIVYTIGNNSSLGIWDDAKGKMTFQGAYKEDYSGRKPTNEVVTKDGTIYTFGMDGKGRFNLSHTTPLGNIKKESFPPIKLSNGKVITNYTITLTFRRAADLQPGMPKTPAKITTSKAAVQPVAQPVTELGVELPTEKIAGNDLLLTPTVLNNTNQVSLIPTRIGLDVNNEANKIKDVNKSSLQPVSEKEETVNYKYYGGDYIIKLKNGIGVEVVALVRPNGTRDNVKKSSQDKILEIFNNDPYALSGSVMTPKSEKTIVVPEGSNPSNMVIAEDETQKFLMNDQQQLAYETISNFISTPKESVGSNQLKEFSDYEEQFNGFIPQEIWNNMFGLIGRGGVGKTTVITKIIKELGINPAVVTYVGPTHNAKTMLIESVFPKLKTDARAISNVKTSASLFKRNQRFGSSDIDRQDFETLVKYYGGVANLSSETLFMEDFSKLKKAYENPYFDGGGLITDNKVIVFDEASMYDEFLFKDLMRHIQLEREVFGQDRKVPILLFLGDYRQLTPPNSKLKEGIISGTLFGRPGRNENKIIELTQVMRTKDQAFHKIFDAVGNIKDDARDSFYVNEKFNPDINQVLNDYDLLTDRSNENMLITPKSNIKNVINIYADELSKTNNPYDIFWTHYNKLYNKNTIELISDIRDVYFDKVSVSDKPDINAKVDIATGIKEGKMTTVSKSKMFPNDFIEFTESLPKQARIYSSIKYISGGYAEKGSLNPRARYKLLDYSIKKQNVINDSLFRSLLRYDTSGEIESHFEKNPYFLDELEVVLNNRYDEIAVANFSSSLFDVVKINWEMVNGKKAPTIKIIHPETGKTFEFKMSGKEFYKNGFNNIDTSPKINTPEQYFELSYVGSTHTVQGNSMKKIIVGDYNIRENVKSADINDIISSLYVGLTRVRNKLIIIKDDNKINPANDESLFDISNGVQPKPITDTDTGTKTEQIKTGSNLKSVKETSGTDDNADIVDRNIVDPVVKSRIDEVIDSLKLDIQNGKKLIFPTNGIGQYLKETAPETFLYLSKRLKELGYKNVGMEAALESAGETFKNDKFIVSDDEVFEAIMCLLNIPKG